MGGAGGRVRAAGAGGAGERGGSHRFVREHLAPHKAPREWVFVDELALTASGKVQKFVLRDRLVEARRGR
jgi:acyl-coenzyme A synthetase/AMP-(fatty) acid ligase